MAEPGFKRLACFYHGEQVAHSAEILKRLYKDENIQGAGRDKRTHRGSEAPNALAAVGAFSPMLEV